MNTLVILAHPALHRSRINAHLATVARDYAQVVNLYDQYPDFEIDVPAEQQRLTSAEHIVLQHPMYWYSTPSLLKEWVDLVFAHGFAYGEDTKELAGKTLCQAISTGGDAEAFSPEGFNSFTIEELLRPMQATAHFCDMHWHEPFLVHGGHQICEDKVNTAGQRYQAWLEKLSANTN